MILKKLNLKNFRTYEDIEIDFSQYKFATIVGRNGVGKSNILEAIQYAIFGKTRIKSEIENIRDCQEQMVVNLTFEHKGHEVKIKRSKKRNTSTCQVEFIVDGKEFENQNKKKKDVQQNIVDFLGFDYDLYCATSLFRQRNNDQFLSGSPAERKSYLNKILQLERFFEIGKRAKDKLDQAKATDQKLKGSLGVFEQSISGIDIADCNQQIANFKQAIEECKAINQNIQIKLQESSKEYEEHRKKISQYNLALESFNFSKTLVSISQKHIEENSESQNSLKSRIESNENNQKQYEDQLNNLREQLNKLIDFSDYKKFYSEKSNAIASIEQLKKSIQQVGSLGVTCYTCQQKVEEIWKNKVEAEAREKIEKLINEISRLDQCITKSDQYNSIKNSIEKIENQIIYCNREKTILESSLNSEIEKSNKIREDFIKNQDKMSENKKILDELEEYRNFNLSSLIKDIDEFKQQLVKGNSEIARAEQELMLKEFVINNYHENVKKYDQILKELSENKIRLDSFDQLANIFNVRIPALIIHNSLSSLMHECNELISRFNLGINIDIDTQSLKADGSFKETLDIRIRIGDIERSLDSLSGGQQEIINFCLRYSLSNLLSNLKNTSIMSVLMDETFASLDSENREAMMSVLNILSERFEQIIAITHIPELKDRFENTIEVVSENGISTIVS